MNDLLAFDHNELGVLLEEFNAALEAENVEQIFEKLDYFWARLAIHIRAEHLHLFPAILGAVESREKISPSQNSVSPEDALVMIEDLRRDHDFFMRELSSAIKQMRSLRGKDSKINPSESLAAVRQKISAISERLDKHNELEETEIYRWVETLLDWSERAVLQKQMQKELDNLPARFAGNL